MYKQHMKHMKAPSDPYALTPKEAQDLLLIKKKSDKKFVHSFISIIDTKGCDRELSSIKKSLKKSKDIRFSGKKMTESGHAIGYFEEGIGYTFLETEMSKIQLIAKKRKLNL